jgi:ATP-binding cassette subfamily F protein uup
MMERFLFTPQMLFQQIGKLSGGERRRLYLVRTLMKDPNFLILDEPTNDLDIPTLQALEDFLDNFAGCLLVVSHDRYFLDRTVDHLMAVEGDGVLRVYPGDYSLYEERRAERQAEETARDAVKAKPVSAATPAKAETQTVNGQVAAPERKKLSYKEQREFEDLEKSFPKWEERLKAIEGELAVPSSDYSALQELTREQSELQEKLETGMERWLELSERAG